MKCKLLSLVTVLAATSAVQAAVITFQPLFLSGANEVPPVVTRGTGEGTVLSYDTAVKSLSLSGTFTNLVGLATAAHVHQAPAGANGPVVFSLSPSVGVGWGTFGASALLTPADEAALLSGGLYVNVHSTQFPGGEIRGQILPVEVPEPGHYALMAGGGLLGYATWRRRRRQR